MKVPNDFAEVMLGVISIFVLMTFTVVNLWYLFNTQDSWDFTGNRIDDWVFEQGGDGDNFGIRALKSGTQMFGVSESFSDTIGLAVGGAKDINSFRENIANDFLPIPTDMTYEGLFYDYYFDTGQQEKCKELFCPSYSYAVSPDPLSDEDQYYLSVGLNSGIKEADFSRKKLNLVVVLDISGSMSSPFNKYYYDQFGNRQELDIEDEEDFEKSKMEVANEAVVSLLDHLNGDDRFGIVLFESDAHIAKPLNLVADVNMGAIKDHILEVHPQGGTNMEAGIKKGTELLEEYASSDQDEYENRIIFLTDAMPNTGSISKDGLFGLANDNADENMYSTFIGIGLDFNTELIEHLTKIRGANYYSVHSPNQFKTRLDDEFEYMVTPLVFDLELNLVADGYDIEKVYGSPEADEATGEIMRVNTLFPSAKQDGQTKGGLVLLKLKKTADNASLNLNVSYEDRRGSQFTNQSEINIEEREEEYFQNNGIQKGILLARYADLVKNWMVDERESEHTIGPFFWRADREVGIGVPPVVAFELGKWERQSSPLVVSDHYQNMFIDFYYYFEGEMENIDDDTMQQELDVIEKLRDY